MNRRSRPLAALLAILALAFSQLAMAVHACDVLNEAKAPVTLQAQPGNGGDCCDHETGKMPQTPLCHSHCEQGQQSLDRAQAPSVPSVLATPFALIAFPAAAPSASWPSQRAPALLARHTEPPLAIRNCCFRI